MKTYFSGDAGDVLVNDTSASTSRTLKPRLDLRDHSPTGFAWGYGGSGPSQLALALLADALGDDRRALRLYQEFKWRVVAQWPQCEPWAITDEEIVAMVAEIDKPLPVLQ